MSKPNTCSGSDLGQICKILDKYSKNQAFVCDKKIHQFGSYKLKDQRLTITTIRDGEIKVSENSILKFTGRYESETLGIVVEEDEVIEEDTDEEEPVIAIAKPKLPKKEKRKDTASVAAKKLKDKIWKYLW